MKFSISDEELELIEVDQLVAELASIHLAHWVFAVQHGLSNGLVVNTGLADDLQAVVVGVEVDKLELVAEFAAVHLAHWILTFEH